MRLQKILTARLCVLAMTVLGVVVPGWGDCGSIPFQSPFLIDMTVDALEDSKSLSYDPLEVIVFEPQQRAIILWNGQEEILLLSTDQYASAKSAVLEVIPLPAKPSVRLGSFATFEEAHRLLVQKRLWVCAHGGVRADAVRLPEPAGRITFQKRMGAHDLSVAEVLDHEAFTGFVQSYLQQRYQTPEAPIRPEFVQIIQSYLDEGFRWFAFDVIQLDGSTKSREPIEYRFKSDRVFYPMRISTMEQGETKVDLLVCTPHGARRFEGLSKSHFSVEPPVEISLRELEALDSRWQGFFGEASGLVLDEWTIEGDIATFVSDVIVR